MNHLLNFIRSFESYYNLYILYADYICGFQSLSAVTFPLLIGIFCINVLSNLIKRYFIKLFSTYWWISYISDTNTLYSKLFKRSIIFLCIFCIFFDIINLLGIFDLIIRVIFF